MRVMRVERHTGPHGELRALFELADDSAAELDGYIDDGVVLVALEDGERIGHLQLTQASGAAEIKNMAVVPAHRGAGVGRALIAAAAELAREQGHHRMLVATGAADVGNLRFYQREGFRMRSVDRDAFIEATGYPPGIVVEGIELRDRVWFDREIGPAPAADGAAVHVLLVTGSTRARSTNTAALRAAAASAAADVATVLYDRLDDLPHFDPDDDFAPLPPAVAELRELIAWADGILFCTPEYAGALPGSFKNLLDWTVGGGEMDGKPAAWINVAGQGRGEKAHASLEIVLGYVAADVRPAARVPLSHRDVDDAGAIASAELRTAVGEAFRAFADSLR